MQIGYFEFPQNSTSSRNQEILHWINWMSYNHYIARTIWGFDTCPGSVKLTLTQIWYKWWSDFAEDKNICGNTVKIIENITSTCISRTNNVHNLRQCPSTIGIHGKINISVSCFKFAAFLQCRTVNASCCSNVLQQFHIMQFLINPDSAFYSSKVHCFSLGSSSDFPEIMQKVQMWLQIPNKTSSFDSIINCVLSIPCLA